MTLSATDFDCVIGLIGHKASGKDVFSRAMAAKGFAEWRVSDPIRAEAVKRRVAIGLGPENMNKYTIKELMDIGDEFRLKGGPGYPAQLMLEMAKHKGDRKVVVNGVRNPGEIIKMREIAGDKLVLVGTTAPIMTRFARASTRHQPEDPLTLDQFLQNDDRDRGIGQPDHGQQVDRCLAQVPHDNTYCNQGTLDTYHAWIDHFSTRHGL